MAEENAVKEGSKVKLDYTGKLEDGSVFDTSKNENAKPLEFTVGQGMVIKGFEDAVQGMKKGEIKTFSIKPEEGYGMPNPELKKPFPREKIPSDQELKPGMALMFSTPDGQQMPALITEVKEKEVILDLNHPLAGKELTFEIEILDVE
jgi:FKBP-type peptidyl-prolyl cis-trans isomerase 2